MYHEIYLNSYDLGLSVGPFTTEIKVLGYAAYVQDEIVIKDISLTYEGADKEGTIEFGQLSLDAQLIIKECLIEEAQKAEVEEHDKYGPV